MRKGMRRRSLFAAAAMGTVAAAILAGTANGRSSTHSSAAGSPVPATPQEAAKQVGNVTLTILDQELNPSGRTEYKQLIASFEKQYPNIKVKEFTKDFNSLTANETLLLAGSNVPDAVETDESYAVQGRLVKAKL